MVKASFYCHHNAYFNVKILGHAEYNPGNDIVCSAVSCLAYTFAGAMQNLEVKVEYSDKSGDFICMVDARESKNMAQIKARTVYDTIYVGILQLSKTYPDNVSVEIYNIQ
jgi:uncharacterized protein YsxB (DUF464 family)